MCFFFEGGGSTLSQTLLNISDQNSIGLCTVHKIFHVLKFRRKRLLMKISQYVIILTVPPPPKKTQQAVSGVVKICIDQHEMIMCICSEKKCCLPLAYTHLMKFTSSSFDVSHHPVSNIGNVLVVSTSILVLLLLCKTAGYASNGHKAFQKLKP